MIGKFIDHRNHQVTTSIEKLVPKDHFLRTIEETIDFSFIEESLEDKVPDHSTISFNRRTRFIDTSIFEEIFDEIVHQAIDHRMVSGRILMTDSTHVKANANKNKFIRKVKEERPKVYMEELEEAVQKDRLEHGKKN